MTRWREREAGESSRPGPGRPARSVREEQPWGGRSWPWSLPHPPGAGLRLQRRRWPAGVPRPRLLRPGPVRREHHDRVLHDGADAGLGRGLLHLQPHAGRPPELPAPLSRQRLLPRRPLSPAQGGPPGPLPTPACSAWGRADGPRSFPPAPAPRPCPAAHSVGHSQPSPPCLRRADHQPASPAGSALRAPRPWPHRRQHLLHWGPRSHRPARTPCPQTLGPQQMPLLRGSCSLGAPTLR